MDLYFAILIGAVINLLFGLNEAKAKPDYRFLIFFKENAISVVLNILCGCVIVYAREEIKEILPITFLSAVFIGSSGQFIWEKIAKIFDSEQNTYIGVNK